MKDLFTKCINATYLSTPDGGNYSAELDGDTVYLLFEWSRGFLDWFHNFLFPAKPYKRMNDVWFCHRGFLKVWRSMRDEAEAAVASMIESNPNVRRIVCVGYSHGGAISLLATEDMQYLYGERLDVCGYGFGAPRVVWGFLPKAVKKRLSVFNVVRNTPDAVTHLPPLIFGFRHAGRLIKIGTRGEYSPIGAHYPDAYIKALGG